MADAQSLEQTPLNAWHRAHGACMTDFNGWDMPLYYRGMIDEHTHTRTAAGLFDLCHMGRIWIRGAGARAFVDSLTPAPVADAADGEVQYSFLLNPDGGVIDDITLYYDPIDMMIVVNAGNRTPVLEWLNSNVSDKDVSVEDYSEKWAMVALQGPTSRKVFEALFGPDAEPEGYYRFSKMSDTICPELLVSRTGYTGEYGYEFYFPAEHTQRVWEALLGAEPEADVWPIGLGARDSLRLEAGMPLYGHELTAELTPFAAGLSKFVHLEKPAFIGHDALARERDAGGPAKKLIAFEMAGRGPIPRHGFEIFASAERGSAIGSVASGIFSPTLQKAIGTGFVDRDQARLGNELFVDIRGRRHLVTVVKRAFYKRSGE